MKQEMIMKYLKYLILIAVLLLVGCDSDWPLTEENGIKIDSDILGVWEYNEDSEQVKLLILKFSETEYLIYYSDKDIPGFYFRGYPIEIDGIRCVQLQLLGSREGQIKFVQYISEYMVARYRLIESGLEVSMLNVEMFEKEPKTKEELRRAFVAHKADKDLFQNPGVFKRAKE